MHPLNALCKQVLDVPRATSDSAVDQILPSIQSIVKKMLGIVIADDQPLMEAGLDSLGAVDLRTAIGEAFRLELPATVMFDHPSITALAQYISMQLGSTTLMPGKTREKT